MPYEMRFVMHKDKNSAFESRTCSGLSADGRIFENLGDRFRFKGNQKMLLTRAAVRPLLSDEYLLSFINGGSTEPSVVRSNARKLTFKDDDTEPKEEPKQTSTVIELENQISFTQIHIDVGYYRILNLDLRTMSSMDNGSQQCAGTKPFLEEYLLRRILSGYVSNTCSFEFDTNFSDVNVILCHSNQSFVMDFLVILTFEDPRLVQFPIYVNPIEQSYPSAFIRISDNTSGQELNNWTATAGSIAEAMQRAQPGTTVYVTPRTYQESVRIAPNQQFTFRAVNPGGPNSIVASVNAGGTEMYLNGVAMQPWQFILPVDDRIPETNPVESHDEFARRHEEARREESARIIARIAENMRIGTSLVVEADPNSPEWEDVTERGVTDSSESGIDAYFGQEGEEDGADNA